MDFLHPDHYLVTASFANDRHVIVWKCIKPGDAEQWSEASASQRDIEVPVLMGALVGAPSWVRAGRRVTKVLIVVTGGWAGSCSSVAVQLWPGWLCWLDGCRLGLHWDLTVRVRGSVQHSKEKQTAASKASARKDLQGDVGFILGRKAKWDKTRWPPGMPGARVWRDAYHMYVSRAGEKFRLKNCFVSILFQWMFHERVLISSGFPEEKHWSWFWGISGAKKIKKKSLSNLFYFLFATGDWRVTTSSAQSTIFYTLCFIAYCWKWHGEKNTKKFCKVKNPMYFRVSHRIYFPFWKS